MSNGLKIILGLVVLAIIAYVIFVPRGEENGVIEESNEQIEEQVTPQESGSISVDDFNQSVSQIVYTDQGFMPAGLTVSVGTPVRFVNQSSGEMHVASAVHPTHEELPGFDQLESGDEYTYTFEEVGTWNFHNHERASHTGTITVIE